MKKILIPLLAVISITGCASVNMLPQNVNNVDFKAAEGKTGWSEYNQVELFPHHSSDQVYSSAKVALGNAGFSLIKADKSKGLVIGEHGITMHDWNVMAGIYFKKIANGTIVKVMVEGSKDIGLSGDVTSDGWSGKIIKGIRDDLKSKNESIININKINSIK